ALASPQKPRQAPAIAPHFTVQPKRCRRSAPPPHSKMRKPICTQSRPPLATANDFASRHTFAACAARSIRAPRHLLRDIWLLSSAASFSWRDAAEGNASRLAYGGARFRLAVGSLGGVFEPLPFRSACPRRRTARPKPSRDAWPVAREDCKMGELSGQHS